MKVYLPIIEKKINEGKIEKIETEKEFDFKPTLAAQIRWEQKFPQQANKESLDVYTKRVLDIKQDNAATIISKFKVLFCYFNTEESFVSFIDMFDFSDIEYIKRLCKAIDDILQLVFDTASEKNL